ncbi:MAG TPA: S9 family peptidase [Thermomicrobiales bacterium]
MPRPLTPETIVYDLAAAGDPQVSPDGSQIAYVLGKAERDKKQTGSQIWLCDVDGGNARRLTWEGERITSPRWSPDGRQLAFASDRVKKPATQGLFVLDLGGGEPREVTKHNVAIGELAWSPDGTRIAYVALFDPDNPEETEPGKEDAPPVRVVRRIDYKQDNRGFLNDVRQRVWVVDVAGGARRMLTNTADDHNFPQWSPDGKTLAVKVPNRNGMASQLGLIDVDSGETTLVGPRDGTVGCWAWSPPGDYILIAGDTAQTWQLDLFLYEVAGGAIRRLTDDLAVQPDTGFPTITPPSQPVWLDDRRALVHALRGGMSGLYVVDTESGAIDKLHDWPAMHGGLSVDASRTVAAQAQTSLENTGEIVVSDLKTGTAKVITHVNDAVFAETPPATWERFDVRRGDFTIEAWLLKPLGFDESQRYPVVLDVHGGPNSWYGYGFNAIQQSLVAAGFLVVYSNPRGSGSYGRNFTQQVIGDWGGEDYRDLMAVVDEVLTRPYADPDRTGIYGYSYGGFMSSWTIGQTDRFKAAVIGAPVVDLESFYGTADIGHYFGPLQIGGRPWDCKQEYDFRSPITYLPKATTPTLIIHGEADDRVPISQGEQLFATLLESGCEVEFARYPGGSHALLRTGYPSHRLDVLERLTGWFKDHLSGGSR